MSTTRSVETTANTIEEAIEIGLEQLQVSRESVIVEIVTEPSRGILGLGARMAVVRLTTAARPVPAPSPSRTDVALNRERPVQAQEVEPDEDEDEDEYLPVGMAEAQPIPEEEQSEDARAGREKLLKLLQMMGVDSADVMVESSGFDEADEKTSILQITGDDLGNLIGRKGETLSALQYITRLMTSHSLQRRVDFVVDAGGYKAKRAETLRKLANRTANRAVERQRTIKLDPMPPHERRIIHMTLRHRRDVTTRSEGEGNYRKVTIIPREN
ncbi:MAG: KH domain-containing protein [Anaerolineae bacterium]|nr:KH domain-containing protein [Anaerolineae bacterium]